MTCESLCRVPCCLGLTELCIRVWARQALVVEIHGRQSEVPTIEDITGLTATSILSPSSRSLLSLRTSIIVLSIKGAMVSKADMLKCSHAHYISLRTSRAYSFRRALPHRLRGPLPRRSKKSTSLAIRCQRVFSSYRPMLKPTNRHEILARASCVQPMPLTGSDTDVSSSQPPHYTTEPARKRHHAQFLSGFLKSVVVALGIYGCINFNSA